MKFVCNTPIFRSFLIDSIRQVADELVSYFLLQMHGRLLEFCSKGLLTYYSYEEL